MQPRLGQRWLPAGIVATITLIVLPSYLGQRTEYGRDPDDDFRFVAETLEDSAQPGDAVALTGNNGLALLAYRESFDGLTDATVGISASDWGRIFDQRFDLQTAKNEILRSDSVWLVEQREDTEASGIMRSLGYRELRRFMGTGSSVVLFERE